MTEFQIFIEFPNLIQKSRWVQILWVKDPRLERNVSRILEEQPNLSSEGFFWLCLDSLSSDRSSVLDRQQKLSKKHLSAFSAKVAVRVINKLKLSLSQFQSSELNREFEADLYQIALEVVLEPRDIFKNYNVRYDNNPLKIRKIESYSYGVIRGKVIDRVRVGRQTAWRTNLGLLVKVSLKQIKDSLENRGEDEQSLQIYLLAVKCFLEVKKADKIGNEARKDEEFDAVVELFHQRNQEILVIPNGFSKIDSEWMNKELNKIGQAIRSYLEVDSNTVSSNTLVNNNSDSKNNEEHNYDLSDNSNISDSPIDDLVSAEQQQKVKAHFYRQFVALDVNSATLLFAYYSLNLTHKQIAEDLDLNTATISRRRQSELRSLLNPIFERDLAVALKLDEDRNDVRTLTNEELNNIKALIETLIKEHYYNLLRQKIKLVLLAECLKDREQQTAGKISARLLQEIGAYFEDADYLSVEKKLLEHLGDTNYSYWQTDIERLISVSIANTSINFDELKPDLKTLAIAIAEIIDSLLFIQQKKLSNIKSTLTAKVKELLKISKF